MQNDTRGDDRWMFLAGLAFLLLSALGALLQGGPPGEQDSADEVVSHFADKETRILAGAFALNVAAAALLVFVSRLRAAIDDRARAARSLLLVGGTVYATAILIGSSVSLSLVVASNAAFKESAQALNVLNSSLWVPLVIGLATMLIGAGLAVLRTGILPRWLGQVAAVVGVVSLLGPGGFLGAVVAPFWVGAAGVMLFLRPAERPVVPAA